MQRPKKFIQGIFFYNFPYNGPFLRTPDRIEITKVSIWYIKVQEN